MSKEKIKESDFARKVIKGLEIVSKRLIQTKIDENQKNKVKVEAKNFTGTYKDNWFGNITISEKKGKMYFNSERSPQLAGEIFFVGLSEEIISDAANHINISAS